MHMRKRHYARLLMKQILQKTPTATSFVCMTLFEVGAIMIESFLKPHYAMEIPVYDFLGKHEKRYTKRKLQRETLRQSIRRLKKYGIVQSDKKRISLTKEGRALLKNVKNTNSILQKRWDWRYRLVIFDVPEKKRDFRDWLREELYLLNYTQLQKSVFIGKYPLPINLLQHIKSHGMWACVHYLLVGEIHNKELRHR